MFVSFRLSLALRLLRWSDALCRVVPSDVCCDSWYRSLPMSLASVEPRLHLLSPHGRVLIGRGVPARVKLAGVCFCLAYRLRVLHD